MADSIHFEAEVSGSDISENEIEDDSEEMKSFINDNSESDNEDTENLEFVNSEINIDEANRRIEQEALARIADCDNYSNLSYASEEDESSVFEFPDALTHINNFKSSLLPKNTEESIHHNFIRVILYKIRQITENKTNISNKEALKENEMIKQIIEQLSVENFDFSLDLQEFNRFCYQINEVLTEHKFFLRVSEQRNKYRNILIKQPEKQSQVKQLASCLSNGFQVIKNSFSKRERREFEPINIIYIPTKNAQILPSCYYTTNIANAYTALYSEGLKTRRSFTIYECYYCNKFFRQIK